MNFNLSNIEQTILHRHLASNNIHDENSSSMNKARIRYEKGIMLTKLAQDSISHNIEKNYVDDLNSDSLQPSLPEPKPQKNINNKAHLLMIMSRIEMLNNEMDENQRVANLATYSAQSEANVHKAQALSTQLDSLNSEFDAIQIEINEAQQNEEAANKKVDNAAKNVSNAQKNLDELLEQKNISSLDDPNALNDPEILQAKKELDNAEKLLKEAKQEQNLARSKTENAIKAGQSTLNDINTLTAKMNKEFSHVVIAGNSAEVQSEKALTRTGIMILLITQFIAKMDEAAADKMKANLEINRIQSQARQVEMMRKSDEYEEQVRKAEEMQKMANCIGKILGGIAIALGAVTTIFGGSGLAVMAIGIALMVADPIVEALTGESLTGMMMNPFMEHVFMPLMNLISGIVGKIFDYTPIGLLLNSIDKATGANMMDTIHTVVAAAATVAAIVAIAMLAKSAAKFMIDKISQAMSSAIMESIKKSITQIMDKIIPQFVKNAGRQSGAAIKTTYQSVNNQIKHVAGKITAQLDKISQKINKSILNVIRPDDLNSIKTMGNIAMNRLEMLRIGVSTATPIVNTGMNINIAQLELEAAKSLAEFDMAKTDVNILRDLVSSILSRFKQDQESSQSMNEKLSDTIKHMTDTSIFITKNIHA